MIYVLYIRVRFVIWCCEHSSLQIYFMWFSDIRVFVVCVLYIRVRILVGCTRVILIVMAYSSEFSHLRVFVKMCCILGSDS